ncbi:ribonuclease T2 [Amniculicola lignicola CBS 123094]|uniref:Ribonuclease T2-like n=1 Tax=Amniculicola lignicola CBS 123094 TaxID=1392246 RepID=A0A6A5WJU0_9PLEO|nr:ribonuclease T2 [Amniculicola lignicola CBS 123094]
MAVLEAWAFAVGERVHNAASPALQHVSSSSSPSTTSAFIASATDMIPSLRTLSKVVVTGAQVLLGGGESALGQADPFSSCANPQLSCHNTTVVENLCCFNAPGGQLLQTQFWDTAPVTGPVDSWTLHGLWPDRCDGTYEANCDHSRAYKNITAILESFGKTELLGYMQTYWKDYQGDDETFWQHEWSKHGTCISTLEPSCYTEHKATEEVADYFQKAVDLFKTLPSYEWLATANILPSTTTTYTFSALQSALQAHRPGVTVTLGCKSSTLNEIWYHYDVRGSLQTGEFIPADPDGTKSSCPQTGIRYLPKGLGSQPSPTSTQTGALPTATSTPGKAFEGKGHLTVLVDGVQKGCIISAGTWYTTGTCATFTSTLLSGGGFTLASSKGNCGVVAGAFTCSGAAASTGFTAVGAKLAAGGNGAWSAERVPRGSGKETVYAGGEHGVGVSIGWEGV